MDGKLHRRRVPLHHSAFVGILFLWPALSRCTVEKYNVQVTKYCTTKKRKEKKDRPVQIYTVMYPFLTTQACMALDTNKANNLQK